MKAVVGFFGFDVWGFKKNSALQNGNFPAERAKGKQYIFFEYFHIHEN